jgi:hypothetical protein
MTTNGTYETLYDWGDEVAVTDQYSIKNTSLRPYSIVNEGECNPNAIESDIYPVNQKGFELKQNYPNPFSVRTQIKYNVFAAAHITLDIYDINGKKVKTLVNEQKSIGSYSVYWDGSDDSGDAVRSGIYFYQLTFVQDSRVTRESRKLMLLR